MKRNIDDYTYKQIAIKITSAEECDAMIPIISKIHSGWYKGKFDSYRDGQPHFYMIAGADRAATASSYEKGCVPASDFLEGYINNTYTLY